jgi:hypothetical protein
VKKSKPVSANPLAMFASSLKSVAGRGENRFFHSLVGTVENSPAIYCWVGGRIESKSQGRLNGCQYLYFWNDLLLGRSKRMSLNPNAV